uniref:Putative conserved secreted protein n=1 Tax=Culex tarsalis TaxID=7177 RepID=A0A1Q3EV87_CULTA
MTPNNVVLFSMLLLPFFVVQVTPLKCFRCNSNDNPDCFNVRPFAKVDAGTSPKAVATNRTNPSSTTTTTTPTTTTVAPTNSSKQLKESVPLFLEKCVPDDKGREPFCRKMVYTVLNNKHHRVVRECGYERSPKDCYMADNEDHLEMVCQCWTDGCNGADRTKFSSIVAITSVIGVLIRSLSN